jgi:hypothetical protein
MFPAADECRVGAIVADAGAAETAGAAEAMTVGWTVPDPTLLGVPWLRRL